MKKTKILSLCIIAVMLLVAICPIVSNADTTVTITFKDKVLAQKIQENIDGSTLSTDGLKLTTTQEKVDQLVNLTLNGCDEVSDLTGLESLKNLRTLDIGGSKVSDLSPIGNLTNLQELRINNNKITSLEPIKDLTNLLYLTVTDNQLTSFAGLENMKKLTEIHAYNNKISDISALSGIDDLKAIMFQNNNITDISVLKKFKNMTYIHIDNNNISNIDALQDMEKLDDFSANNNKISDVSKVNANCPAINPGNGQNSYWFSLEEQSIVQPVKLKGAGDEVTIDLPQIFVASQTEGNMLYTGKPLVVENGTVNGTKVTAKVADIKAGKVTVTIDGTNPTWQQKTADRTKVTFTEAFEVLDVKKEPETANADKVKVTITVNKELNPNKIPDGWTLGEDGKSVSKEFDKNGKEDVVLTDKDGNTVTQTVDVSNIKEGNKDEENNDGEEFKVIDETEEDQGNGKVKVTITVNKELDPDKIPDGWTLGDDGKSIWKVMDKGAKEEITLVAKDGSTIKYTVIAGDTLNSDDDNTKAPSKIPQTGVVNTILVVIGAVAIVGTVLFIRSRKMLK